MDFFNSVFSDPDQPPSPPDSSIPSSSSSSAAAPSWQFGSTIFRTLASKSESLLDNYYKDFQEFSSGFAKETSVIREAASRAVHDLPGRLESGAAIAQESLEAVGQAIDDVGSTVSEIIGKDLNFANIRLIDPPRDGNSASGSGGDLDRVSKSSGDDYYVKPYNRLEAMIRSLQCDARTYCNEVVNSDYSDWKTRFRVENMRDEITKLIEDNENGVIREIYNEVVPRKVDNETFWCRYFYKVDEVVKAEEARLRIVKRAFSGDKEEELSWDVDDDENGQENEDDSIKNDVGEKGKASVSKSDIVADESRLISTEKEGSDGKIGSDISVISSQRSEDDGGWDQIEDIPSSDEGKVGGKMTNNAGDEEILSWDIEDDD
ncbi:uncharacterized protein LOC127247899 [Andrographis paniculata]|uniref:uncharacterized protein LOC127247899 n=1 Tax=Andrographis paniculata TaxID=175694 RepID=UPI0021E97DB5|nr:uncharacterized protein LOC127247899 [Andrographis paniculata]